ncbi:MAG: hypothetical protein ACUVTU_06225, partial [Desulfurispora sp.]
MKVITELELRDRYRQAPFSSFELPAGARLTPAAAQFLHERKISLIQPSPSPLPAAQPTARSRGPAAPAAARPQAGRLAETLPGGGGGVSPVAVGFASTRLRTAGVSWRARGGSGIGWGRGGRVRVWGGGGGPPPPPPRGGGGGASLACLMCSGRSWTAR